MHIYRDQYFKLYTQETTTARASPHGTDDLAHPTSKQMFSPCDSPGKWMWTRRGYLGISKQFTSHPKWCCHTNRDHFSRTRSTENLVV